MVDLFLSFIIFLPDILIVIKVADVEKNYEKEETRKGKKFITPLNI
jgi:hypothetical protein